MKLSTKLLGAAGLALSMVGSAANAGAILNNWVLNPMGTGFNSLQAVQVIDHLDVTGLAFIKLTPAGGSSFAFSENAVFKVSGADNGLTDVPGPITALFQGSGAGNFNGTFSFDSGTITLFVNGTPSRYGSTDGIYGAGSNGTASNGLSVFTQIAKFDVTPGGGGKVDGSGSAVGNGDITVFAKATTPGGLTPGYFFRGNGNDLSNEDILSFAFTNANTPTGLSGNAVSEIACQYAGYTGAGCDSTAYHDNPGQNFFVSNGGQFKLAEVPEPTSIALFGIAMLGAGLASRKRKA